MFQRLKNSINLVRNMGLRYISYRVKYEFLIHSGLLKKRFPVNPSAPPLPYVETWRRQKGKFFFDNKDCIELAKNPTPELEKKFNDIVAGEFLFFNGTRFELGSQYDWVTNPENGYRYDVSKHWTQIPDYSRQAGDIKYVWEKSRFSFLYVLIRYDYHFNRDCSGLVFSEILSWIDHNPVNCGPNYRCSQEISLRVLNWIFALHYYKNSSALTDSVFKKIMTNIYWQAKHVYANINFSRIAVRNNHAITETMGLYLFGILLPFFPEAADWKRAGKKWFEQEIAYQVYVDGTFLQFSMNYHRVVVQLLTWAIQLSAINTESLAKVVRDRASASLDFLFNCMSLENGYLPNYGANDGALFFPLSDCDFRDYRPQLHTLSSLLHEGSIEENSEEQFWYGINEMENNTRIQKQGMLKYPIGGYYLLREEDTFTFIRCGKHKDRPSHADNLHVDIWVKGKNVMRDSGSYKYNTENQTMEYFQGTASHNTVMVEDHSQMLKGGRFIWYYWSQAQSAGWSESIDEYKFQGKVSAFRFLNPLAVHKRIVIKKKGKLEWIVIDKLIGLPHVRKKQIWHYDDHPLQIAAQTPPGNHVAPAEVPSFNSVYYGTKEKGKACAFLFDAEISTTLTFL